MIILFALLIAAAFLAAGWLLIGTIEPEPARYVPDKLDELVACFRQPGPDWAEVDALFARPFAVRGMVVGTVLA